jgi:hypothetical protein
MSDLGTLDRMRSPLLVVAVWLGTCIAPNISLGQDELPAATPAKLAVRPWLHPAEWLRVVGADAFGRASWLPNEPDTGEKTALDGGMTWTSTFAEREAHTHDSRTMMSGQAQVSSPLWSGTMTADVNFLAVESPNSIGLWAEPNRWLRVAVNESWGPVSAGVRFESAGPELERVTGGRVKEETEGSEAWIEGRAGPVRLRFSGGRFWDNLADYPWQPRTTKTQGGASMEIALPLGARLGLGYQGGLAERQSGPRSRTALGAELQTSAFHNLVTSIYRSGSTWSVAVSSTYSPSSDLRNGDRETVTLATDVSATFRLLKSLTLTHAVGIAEDTYEWAGTTSQTTSASLWVSWTSVLEGVDVTVSGSYARNRTGDDLNDATAVSAAAGLVWRLPRTRPAGASLALEVGSNHYLDRVTASAGSKEVYAMLTFRIKTF